jgi:DHA1 family bicyclomycin/chloramphenicol resistance-like MFS transporter
MTAYFGVPAYQTGFTLTFFIILCAVSLLVSGPLNDRYGRKPVAVAGLTIHAAAGALCAVLFAVHSLWGSSRWGPRWPSRRLCGVD